MKKISAICLILCLILLMQPVQVYSAQGNGLSCGGLDASAALAGQEKMLETADAALVYDRSSGTMIYGYNADARIYPTSMVKLMTAIVALENGNLEDMVVVSRAALDSVAIGSVSAGLVRWEEISLRDLLYCMMVASANDASAVIAMHVGGSIDQFITMMNEKARQLGCQDTNFSNVHGLHDENTYTTARDICKILNYGLENELFRAMFETKAYTVPATNKNEERNIITTNYLMSKGYTSKYYDKYFDSRVTGGKTGGTDAAGRCVAVTAKVNNMDLIAIVMGADPYYTDDGLSVTRFGSFEEMTELLDFVEKGYEVGQIFYANQVIDRYSVSGGDSDVAVSPVDSMYCVVPKELKFEELTWYVGSGTNSITAPVQKGQVITQLSVWYQGICIGNTDLVAMHDVKVYEPYIEPDIHSPLEQEDNHGNLIATIALGVLGLVVLGFVIMVLRRLVHVAVVKARIRRRKKARRRPYARME